MVTRSRRRARRLLAAVALAVVVAACSRGDGGLPDSLREEDDGPNRGSLPTIPGGVDLPKTEVNRALVGAELAYGSPLPSETLAAEGFKEDPEVSGVAARRVYQVTDARYLADLVILRIRGHEVFDLAALASFEEAVVSAFTGDDRADSEGVTIAGTELTKASGERATALGFRTGDLLVLLRSPSAADVAFVATRQLEAIARGEVGSAMPATPLPLTPPEAAFVTMRSVAFAPIPAPEEEPGGPEPPVFAGATGVHGRYGVVAGERRTVVWVLTLDPAVYPTAEALDPALPALASGRAGDAPPELSEVVDRVVLSATQEPGEPSARVFRHGGLVVVVEGDRPDHVDAVVTAWITALAGV